MPRKPTTKDFFQILRDRFSYGLKRDAEDRKAAEEDVRFANGDQWDRRAKLARKKRPCLTENRLGPSINQVVNDGRENKPAILTVPMDGGTPETAEYFQGRIRHVEYECDADEAYDTARRQQISSGRGWLRVCTRYATSKRAKKGQQEVYIEAIDNQFAVVWDPDAKRYDKSDARWAFVIRRMSREAYENEFGNQTLASRHGFYLQGGINPAPDWIGVGTSSDDVQVADYYERTEDEDGKSTVTIYCSNGIENLDKTEWLGSTIPLIPLFGEEVVIDGVKRTFSLVRHAKDAQKLVNLYVSNIAEQISQMPKAPYLVAEGQIEGREGEWGTINEVQRAVAQYKRFIDGQDHGVPIRNTAEPPIQALVQGYLQAVDAVKAAMGIFDAALGARSNETSGLAINARKKESDATNFHFMDNESRSRKRLGRILIEILPQLDGDEPAEKPVRAEDGKVTLVKINQPYTHPKTLKEVTHDMTSDADYGIAVKTGTSYESQREAENERQGELIQAVPDLMWIIGDLYFRTSDTPGAEIIADRMERAIQMRTPGLIDQKDQDPRKQLQQTMQKLQQMSQLNQALTAEVHKLAQTIETKQAENATRERIAALQAWKDIKVAEITKLLKEGIADADREGDRLEGMFDRAHETAMEAMQHSHAVDQQKQQAQIQQQQIDQQQGHDQQMQESQQNAAADMQDASAQNASEMARQQTDQQPDAAA
jgi:hypothetical protein